MQTAPMCMSDEDYKKLRHSFSWALEKLKHGKKVTRDSFKKGMYIFMVVNDWHYTDEFGLSCDKGIEKMFIHPYIMMVKDGIGFPTDLSCESIFGEDWYEID